ncbi:MAG: hypothetical protein FWE80_09780 [Oscillospiraceae bacterium]|nr:hypothetical protein [Oscillospiraceae bacterium]
MEPASTPVTFFLGANTPAGFVEFTGDLYDPHDGWRVYILKGGPGTGKSSLLRALWTRMAELGAEVELIRCSSDPQSLDAVRLPGIKVLVIDGTHPHVGRTEAQNFELRTQSSKFRKESEKHLFCFSDSFLLYKRVGF